MRCISGNHFEKQKKSILNENETTKEKVCNESYKCWKEFSKRVNMASKWNKTANAFVLAHFN